MRTAELTKRALLRRGRRPILHETAGRSISGEELVERVERLAGKLLETGSDEPVIGVWYRNKLEAVEAFLAVEWAGLTRIAVDPNAPPAEAMATFKAAGASLILADAEHAHMLGEAAVVHDADATFFGDPIAPRADVDPGKPLNLYPRSVTNGRLFAIAFSYANWDAIVRTNAELYRAGLYGPWEEESEVFLASQQVMHATGLVGTFPFLSMGRPQVLVDHFSAPDVVDAIDRYEVTATMLVPQMLTRLVAEAEAKPGSATSLRHILYGGGPVQIEDIKRAIRRFGSRLSQLYGRMEGGWPISVLGPEEHEAIANGDRLLATSCGRPIDQVAIRLRPLSPQDAGKGELLVAGDMTVAEYKGADGYCSLGDIMEQDGRGYLFYRGRLDRMINTGYHIYPAEIEEVISGVPGVRNVLVAGRPNREWGETVVAFLVAAPGIDVTELIDRVRQEVSAKLARYKVPREFVAVDRLPPASGSRGGKEDA